MFEMFTDWARAAILNTREEARWLGSAYVDNGHILLGILKVEESGTAQTLASLNVTYDSARKAAKELFGGSQASGENIPFTPRARNTLELALREAKECSYDNVAPDHILLGILRQHWDGKYTYACEAVKILHALGVDLNVLQLRLLDKMGLAANPEQAESDESRHDGYSPMSVVTLDVPRCVHDELNRQLSGVIPHSREYYETLAGVFAEQARRIP